MRAASAWLLLGAGAIALSACTSHRDRRAEPEPESKAAEAEATGPEAEKVVEVEGPKSEAPVAAELRVACPEARPSGSLMPVAQNELRGWGEFFDPGGEYVARSTGADDCEVWEIASGRLLGSFDRPGDRACQTWPDPEGAYPCEDWAEAEGLQVFGTQRGLLPLSAPGLELVPGKTELLVREVDSERERVRASCSECERYFGHSIHGGQFVAFNDRAVEFYSLADGERVERVSLVDPPAIGGELQAAAVVWAGERPAVLTRRRNPGCEDGDEACHLRLGWDEDVDIWELRRRRSGPKGRLEVHRITPDMSPAGRDQPPVELLEFGVDPLGRWLFIQFDSCDAHDCPVLFRALSLDGSSLDDAPLIFDQDHNEDAWVDEEVEAEWIAGNRLAWGARVTERSGDGEGEYADVAWAAVELWPSYAEAGGELPDWYLVEERRFELFGVAEGRAARRWSVCFDPDTSRAELLEYNEQQEPPLEPLLGEDGCVHDGPAPAGCEGLATSFDLRWLLARCGDARRLIPLGEDAGERSPVSLAEQAGAGDQGFVYAREGLALLAGDVLHHYDRKGGPRGRVEGVEALLPARLDDELGVAVGRRAEELVFLELDEGDRRRALSLEALGFEPRDLAFSPTGEGVALSDGETIAVMSWPGLVERARWRPDAALVAMAWRQDGAALFTGHHEARPERAWDPGTGKELPALLDPMVLYLDEGELEPGWRWAFVDDAGDELLRTLDGQILEFTGPTVMLASGLWDAKQPGVGEVEAPAVFMRVVGLEYPALFELAELPDRLRRPGLLADFLAGVPLPRPVLSAAERAALPGAPTREGPAGEGP